MSLDIEDLDIYILSHNREQFLFKTIESLFNQSIQPKKITILDNGSDKKLIHNISNLRDKRIRLKKTDTNKGVVWNFNRAIKEAKALYTIILHDDDIIHYQYLEHVLKLLNLFPGIGLICSGMKISNKPENLKMKKYNLKFKYFKNALGLLQMAFFGFPINFSSSVYSTSILKKTNYQFHKYNKISDRPFMFEMANINNVAILPAQYIYYRIHDFQDSNTLKTGPFESHLINLHKLYYKELFKGGVFSKFIFYSNFKYHLKKEFKNLDHKNFKDYQKEVYKNLGITSRQVILIEIAHFLSFYLIFKIYRFSKRMFFQYS